METRIPNPTHKLKCLMVQPRFSAFSFWNFVEACSHLGAKTPSPPLGLITVAALLPQEWEFRLMDLNCREFSQSDWDWADIVCVGGMLPQQKGILEIIDLANKTGKYIAAGGSDPSSQPEIYSKANALVVGEGESAIPVWLDSWRKGQPNGVFKETEKPDVTLSPIPRYDLLDFRNYSMIGVQYSRGCPFNCEFCDIIELFGRKPRSKAPGQFLKELDRLRELGYSGHVDIVDDNFIGNKRNIKRHLLPALISWNKKRLWPFFYATEASMNLADDEELMGQMAKAGFRFVFLGIETPDPELLLKTQKSQNTVRPIIQRVNKIYNHGMVVTAGFIMGFDGEKAGVDKAMIDLIEATNINMAMIGLLVALPNTQLTRRLLKEKRLMSFRGKLIDSEKDLREGASESKSMVEIVDQTVAGLNFITSRDRVDILKEFLNVVQTVYEPKAYFDRALRMALALKPGASHWPRWFEIRRNMKALVTVAIQMTKDKDTRRLYWRNFPRFLFRGHIVMEQALRVSAMYLHFKKQVAFLKGVMVQQIKMQEESMPKELRKLQTPLPPRVAVKDDTADAQREVG